MLLCNWLSDWCCSEPCVSSFAQRVSVQNIRQDMREFRELSVSLKLAANRSAYIVDFYGYCLRDVSEALSHVTS